MNANGFFVEHVEVAACGRSLDVTVLKFLRVKGDLALGEFQLKTDGAHYLEPGDRFWLYSPYWAEPRLPYNPGALPDPKVFHCGNYRVEDILSSDEFTAIVADDTFSRTATGGPGVVEAFYREHPVATGLYSIVTGHGISTRGQDSQTGNVIGCIFTGNSGWGMLEYSQFGNTYIGCNCQENVLGQYHSTNLTSASTFLGNHAEPGPPSIICSPTAMMGGASGPLIKKLFPQGPRFLAIAEVEKMTPVWGNRQTDYLHEPRDEPPEDSPATWEKGDRVNTFASPNPNPTGVEGSICDQSGTFTRRQTLPEMTSDGSRIVRASCVVLNPKTGNLDPTLCGLPRLGEWIQIQGQRVRVEHKVLLDTEPLTTHFVMSAVVPAGVAQPATYAHPTFKKYGVVHP